MVNLKPTSTSHDNPLLGDHIASPNDLGSTDDIDFQRYWFTLKRRWLPATLVFVTVPCIAMVIAMLQKPIYQARGVLLIRPDQSSNLIGLDVETATPQAITAQNTVNTQISLLKSVPIAQEVIAALGLKDKEGKPVKVSTFLKKLKVKDIKRSDSLEVVYESEDAVKAAQVVDKVLQVYINNNVTINRSEATAAREFIERQLPQVEANVHQAEEELQRLQEENQIFALNRDAQTVADSLVLTERQFSEAETRLSALNARLSTLHSQLNMAPEQIYDLAALSQSQGVQEVLVEYQQIQSRLAIQRTRYDEEHPSVRTLVRQENALRNLLTNRIEDTLGNAGPDLTESSIAKLKLNEFESNIIAEIFKAEVEQAAAREQYQAALQDLQEQQRRAKNMPGVIKAYNRAEQNLEVAQSTYKNLLNRQQEIRLTENQNIGNARIVSTALVPDSPIYPSKKLFLAAGLSLGTLAALGTAFSLDLLDMRLKTVKEVQDIYPYPMLGVIPLMTPNSLPNQKLHNYRSFNEDLMAEETGYIIFARDYPNSLRGEAYETIRTNIDFLAVGTPNKVKYLFTSTMPGEGKSTVSANFAASNAYAGKKVVLLDADMRKSSQHKIWRVNKGPGLADLLTSRATLKEATAEVLPNLDLIPSGMPNQSPVSLLESPNFSKLLDELNQHYDLIIIDTPPLVVASDAVILSRHTDVFIYIARPDLLDYKSARSVRTRLQNITLNPDGLVINGVKVEADPYSYSYGAGYT